MPEKSKEIKKERDQEIRDIFTGKSDKFIVLVGPCSADNEDSVCEYVNRLAKVNEKVSDRLMIIPRIYTNKPRTTGEGYKGMLHQPEPDKAPDLLAGIIAIRKMHLRAIEESGLTAADEMLYPENRSYLKYFKLYKYDDGFVIQMPERSVPEIVPPFEPQNKLFQVLKESTKWGDMQGIETVGALNDKITKGDMMETVLVQEALQEKKIAEIAATIASNPKIKFVLIAGPSSSGKTTFSHRLSIQLRANGLVPHPIAVDNYFVEREENPKDEKGNYDYECLEAVDRELFNRQLQDLLDGKEVVIPTFNFVTGHKEYGKETKKLGENDVLVIEGIHCLNPKLTEHLQDENKFKIYISALTQLNIDEHNRIPTTDGRLLRRIVRDARTRGSSAERTIRMWPSVRRGEERNIFPYQEQADVMFNSALIYELAVLKPYVEALLFGIDREAPEYMEAKRLLKFLDYFVGIGSENVPTNSLLREFIGGGCFHI